MKKLIILFFVLLHLKGFSQECPILPAPVTYQKINSTIEIPSEINVDLSDLSDNLIKQFGELNKFYHQFQTTQSKEESFITFKKLKNVIHDSYSINVTDNITISYSSDASCFYAINSLFQLIKNENSQFSISKCFVKDYPKFQWRGLHLDVARHFFTVEEVKRYIDLMSMYKFNTFHWHLTDDQGWRIEIKQFPKLTDMGSWRDSTLNNHYSTKPRTFTKQRYGGFYTQDQIKEIIAYASSKYITVVPEIEMPGHSRAALAAYPEYSCNGVGQGVEGLWGVFDDIFCSKDETIQFLQKILEEIIPLFPGEYIHIGGDEAPKTRWKKCKNCQSVIQKNNLKDEHQLQSYFIQQMDKFLTSKGKKLIGWDEILEGGLSPNAAVMSWRGFEGGIEAASQEHYVVMSPGSHCYFDHYQGKGKDEPLAIGGFTPLEKVYEFNPIPEKLDKKFEHYILGGQANLWTEYIPDFKKVEYMVYPRAIALSQTLWCTTKPDFDSFKSALINFHFPILNKNRVNFCKSSISPKIEWKSSKTGVKFKLNSYNPQEKFELALSKTKSEKNEGVEFLSNIENFNFILTQGKWMEINRSEKDLSKYNFHIRSNVDSLTNNFVVNATFSLGAPIEFITKPSPNYNSGLLTLVDGQFGSLPWKGNEWIGFDIKEIEFELDLLKKRKYNQVNISFLSEENSWIHFPKNVKLILDDQTEIFDYKILKSSNEQIRVISFELPNSTRKIKFRINSINSIPVGLPGEGNIPWTFMDEIQVIR